MFREVRHYVFRKQPPKGTTKGTQMILLTNDQTDPLTLGNLKFKAVKKLIAVIAKQAAEVAYVPANGDNLNLMVAFAKLMLAPVDKRDPEPKDDVLDSNKFFLNLINKTLREIEATASRLEMSASFDSSRRLGQIERRLQEALLSLLAFATEC